MSVPEPRSSEDIKQIDNFLEAHLDAKLVHDEVKINENIGNLTDKEFITECKKEQARHNRTRYIELD